MDRFAVYILFFLLTIVSKAGAQETLMTEISYPFLDKLIQTARENYPRMKSMDKQVSIAEINVKRAKISWFEVLNFTYFFNTNSSSKAVVNPGLLNGYQLGVNLNFGSLVQKPTQIKASKEELEIAQFQKEEYTLTLEADVKQRYFQYMQQLATLKLSMQSAQDGENLLKSIKNKYEKGEETFETYNRALVAFNAQNQQKISAESAVLIAKAHLEEIIGKHLEEVK